MKKYEPDFDTEKCRAENSEGVEKCSFRRDRNLKNVHRFCTAEFVMVPKITALWCTKEALKFAGLDILNKCDQTYVQQKKKCDDALETARNSDGMIRR